ncbi:ABC transporter permease [Rubrimonas cliftonensis]|uniref:Nucleoside ABC transporter membrane protein n=1 Tax=Rubrimonas cliftonensis TaxID=89524 RepID=A0A1H3YDT3_9RHOB|nr:ABC transporter permease [Rubrimonas cliftonensis]SEA09686.1 nucleoside ABC transporter membrane protein [Rubrimonas cliftonensis]
MIALEARPEASRALALASPALAIVLTLLASAALIAALGRDPLSALHVYFVSPFLDGYSRAEILVKATPLALMGAGLAISFRANVWNIGAAGQYTLGALAAGAVALAAPEARSALWLAPYLAAGVAGGMLWAAAPALLRTRFGANEILVSLMLTYVAGLLLDWLVRGPWRSPLSFGFPQSRDFAEAFVLPVILDGTRLHVGAPAALLIAAALALLMARTLRGFSVRVIGASPRAGAFAGFGESGTVWFALLLSGGLAGLAGAIEVGAVIGKIQPDIGASAGFTAIIVAFLGRLNPLGAVLGALVLAVSVIGGENAQILLKLPKNVTGVFQGMLLFFLLACDVLIRWRVVWRRKGAA